MLTSNRYKVSQITEILLTNHFQEFKNCRKVSFSKYWDLKFERVLAAAGDVAQNQQCCLSKEVSDMH